MRHANPVLAPLLAVLLVAAAPAALAQRGRSTGLFAAGQPLPHLVLPSIDGKRTVDLAELRGTRLLLIQFASW